MSYIIFFPPVFPISDKKVFVICTYNIPENHLHHRSGRSSGPCASVWAARRCLGIGHRRICRVDVLCDWCRPDHHVLCDVPVPYGCTTYARRRRSGHQDNLLLNRFVMWHFNIIIDSCFVFLPWGALCRVYSRKAHAVSSCAAPVLQIWRTPSVLGSGYTLIAAGA